MLTIRRRQHKEIADASREKFIRRIESHLREHFRVVVGLLTSDQLQEIIERNWKRAEEYGLKSELGVCSYLNVVFTLGEEFEKQPAYPWAAPLLTSAELGEETKLPRLDAAVQEVLRKAKESEVR